MLAIVSTLLYGDGMTDRKSPNFELPTIDADKVVEFAKDAVYVTVGIGVLAYQKAQVRRQELTTFVNERLGSSKTQLEELKKTFEARINEFDQRVVELEHKLDGIVEQVEGRLPEPAGEALHKAYDAARTARQQVRDLITKAA